MNKYLLYILISAGSLLIYGPVLADKIDESWEQEISEKLAERAEPEEVLWLEADGREFLGLYKRHSSDIAHGAVIILHSMGAHADWPQTVSPLRHLLPQHGWSSLSLQMPLIAPENPVEDYGATINQAMSRIDSAIRFLREKKFLNIIVVGHGFGSINALAYLAKQQEAKIISAVGIGIKDYNFLKPSINTLELIENTNTPLLDIYGGNDYKDVINQAPDRRLAAKKGKNSKFSQYQIEGADHYFSKMEDVLVKRIRSWLNVAAPGVSIVVDENFDGNRDEDEENPPEQ